MGLRMFHYVRIQNKILWDLEGSTKYQGLYVVIFMLSYRFHFWSTMLPQEEQDTIRNGATLLESEAKNLLFHYE
uniref:Uncharacterized protein n=1 Tax=Oryza punctata TaxID=4537 RepID=A0A0E0K0N6_ORYPU